MTERDDLKERLEQTRRDLSERMERIEKRMDRLETRQERLEEKIDKLSDKIDDLRKEAGAKTRHWQSVAFGALGIAIGTAINYLK